MPRYRVLPHTADVGIAAAGATIEEAFENAAYGMFDLMFDLAVAQGDEVCRVEAEGDTPAELLVAWLSALLAEAEIRGLALRRFEVEEIGGGRLRGRRRAAGVGGSGVARPADQGGHPSRGGGGGSAGGWEARVIFDV